MHRLSYVSGTGGVEACLDCRSALAGTAAGIRGREWDYSIGYMSLSGVTRAARECSLSVAFMRLASADELRRLADRDMSEGTPGRLEVDGWSQRAYVTKAEPSSISRSHVTMSLTVVLLDGVWRKGHTEQYVPRHAAANAGDSLDLPYDLPCDLAAPSARQYIETGEWGAAPLKAVVYGPCINPAFRVAGNLYEVDATVQDGGEYIFQPLPPGRHEIEWDGSFGIDLTWYEEEGEPPWSR